ncbi:MAG: phage portal protein [Candidatus Margulisbacteria bacterium]|nr:phage portal protein [Candidatus Margulisiibacteriota bacterium]
MADTLEQQLVDEIPMIIDGYSVEASDEDIRSGLSSVIVKQLDPIHLEQSRRANSLFGVENVVPVPYDKLALAFLAEKNTRLSRSIELRSRLTVGIDWSLELGKKYLKLVSEAERKKNEKLVQEELLQLELLFSRPNNYEPFTELSYKAKYDEEAHGDGYVEIIRNQLGETKQLHHISGHTIRRLYKNNLYVQMRDNQKVFYKSVGDHRFFSASTGEKLDSYDIDDNANELMQFSIYSPRSSWYGVPRWIPAIAALCGGRLAAERAITFFENDATPRLAIVVSGGKLDQESVKKIQGFLKRGNKGTQNAHRIMVLQADAKKTVGTKGTDTKIEIHPLTVGNGEDASFQEYRKLNDEEVRESMGISVPFFSATNVNKASAYHLRKMTNEQEFEPDAKSHEYKWDLAVLSERIIGQRWLINPISLKYQQPTQIDEIDLAEVLSSYANAGVLTINESRIRIGMPPLPKDIEWGNMPFPFAMAFFTEKYKLTSSENVESLPLDDISVSTKPGTEIVVIDEGDTEEDVINKIEKKAKCLSNR